MTTLVRRVTDVAARLVLTTATVAGVRDGAGFRTIDLAGERLRGAQWIPGDKLRIRTEGLALRTYTPIRWDAVSGTARILAYTHGAGPGADWCRAAAAGDDCELRGPDRSVRLDRVQGAAMFVGDETSFGLLLAWHGFRPETPPAAALFEVTRAAASRSILAANDAPADLVERAAGESHRADFARRVCETVRAHPEVTLVLTGRAQTIAAVRRALKSDAVAPRATIVKAYWDERRKGLD